MYDKESIKRLVAINKEFSETIEYLDNQIKSLENQISNLKEEKMALFNENQLLKDKLNGKA